MPYGFRLLFRPLGPAVDADAELTLPTGAVVQAAGGGILRDTPARLVLRRGGYPTEDAAREDGERHRLALYLGGPTSGYPVDAQDGPGSGFGRVVKEEALKHGVRLLDSPVGLQVFPEDDLQNRWIHMSATGVVRCAASAFADRFADTYGRVSTRSPSDQERLALELFNLAHVDASPRARFMTFTTVVEVLAAQAPRSESARAFLDECIRDLAGSHLSTEDQTSLRNALGNLQRESITSACQATVARHLGVDRGREFRDLYRIRGQLTHRGSQHVPLSARLAVLKALVADLLAAHFR